VVPAHLRALETRSSFRTSSVGRTPILLAVLLTAIVLVAAVWTHLALKAEVERQVGSELHAVVETATRAAHGFYDTTERMANLVATAPMVQTAVGQDQGSLASAVAPLLDAAGAAGFVLVDAGCRVLVSGGEAPPVGQSLDPEACPAGEALRRGGPRAGLPLRVGSKIEIVALAPVRGSPLLLGITIPAQQLSEPLLAARGGTTGETYAVDRAGRMQTSSRFPHHLRRAGLLGPDVEDSSLVLEIRDPGFDTSEGVRPETLRRDQPLTRAAAALAAGRDGESLEPYRDYRGIEVVGAWRWFAERGLGVITEIDAAEAFAPMGALRRVFSLLVALLVLTGVAVAFGLAVVGRARLRAARAERRAQKLGSYVIERQLGGGAMGEVFLARHALLRRPTALKLMRADRAAPEAAERFEREVQVTATLTHPNTIAIYDYGRSEAGEFYYAMEYLEGIDLEQLVTRSGPVVDALAIHILRQVCGSLAEAHGAGLVHRDIKPANIFLCRRGGMRDVVKVLDFGLVRAAGDRQATRASVILGTPENMAPELFESSSNASPASDIYALGCTGYHLVTGEAVFGAGSVAELCNAHLSKSPVPPSEKLGRPVDPMLERTLLSCLAKEPSQRPRSAREVAALLARSALASAWKPEADEPARAQSR